MKRNLILMLSCILSSATALLGQYPDTSWVLRYNYPVGVSNEIITCAERTGYVYIAGRSATAPYDDFLLTKVNALNGQVVWSRTYNSVFNKNDNAYGVCIDDSGMIYVAGRCGDTSGSGQTMVVKCEPDSGDTAWMRCFRVVPGHSGFAFAGLCRAGMLYLCGGTSTSGSSSAWLAKIDPSDGDTVWTWIHDTISVYEGARACVADEAGSIYLVGFSEYANIQAMTMKCDGVSGAAIWARTYSIAPGWSLDVYAAAYRDGYLYFVGDADSGGTCAAAIAKLDAATGDTIWTRRYLGGQFNDNARGCAIDSSGDLFVCGYSFNSSLNNDVIVWRYHPDGQLVSTYRYDGNPNHNDGALACTFDADNSLYAAGGSVENGILTALLIKFEGPSAGVSEQELIAARRMLFVYQKSIHFSLEHSGVVSLTIYNSLGQIVTRLLDRQYRVSGSHVVNWNGLAGQSRTASGIYFVRLQVDAENFVRKMTIVK